MSYVFSFTFFFTAAHFLLALVAASISHFVTAATKFSCCSSNKKMSPLFFIFRPRSLSPFSRWASLACRLYFRLCWLYNLELHLGCHTCWIILHWYACGADGRSFGRCTVTWLPNFGGQIDFLTQGAPQRAIESSAISLQCVSWAARWPDVRSFSNWFEIIYLLHVRGLQSMHNYWRWFINWCNIMGRTFPCHLFFFKRFRHHLTLTKQMYSDYPLAFVLMLTWPSWLISTNWHKY